MSPPGPGLLWGFDLSASIRNCMAAYASSACFAHESHRGAIWLHVAFSSPRLEHALVRIRRHGTEILPMDSPRYLVEGAQVPRVKFKIASQFQHSLKKNALRRSNEAAGGSHWWPGSEMPPRVWATTLTFSSQVLC